MKLRFGDFVLDCETRQLFRSGVEVRLRPKEFELLELLALARPRALSKLAIRQKLWPDTVVGDASLAVAVAALRSALADDARQPAYIRTVYGYGYAFGTAAISVPGVAPAPPGRGLPAPRVVWERRVFPLLEGENLLGRDDDAMIRIDAPSVSRRHARIQVEDGAATIEDLGSKNGTFVGDKTSPITRSQPLADGARFRLGRVTLQFRSSPEKGETVTVTDGRES